MGERHPIETYLEETKKAGYTGIQLGGKFPRNPGITKFLLDKYKLKMPVGWYGSSIKYRSAEDEWIAMQNHINLLKFIKASVFLFAYVCRPIPIEEKY